MDLEGVRHWTSREMPAIDTRTKCVVGWKFWLHLEKDGVEAFEELTVAGNYDGRAPRPLDQWSQAEFRHMVLACLVNHPVAQGLRANLDARLYVREHEDFRLSTLKES